jgi:hypothetical protein
MALLRERIVKSFFMDNFCMDPTKVVTNNHKFTVAFFIHCVNLSSIQYCLCSKRKHIKSLINNTINYTQERFKRKLMGISLSLPRITFFMSNHRLHQG